MKITVEASELSNKISIVSKTVPSKTIKPIMECILFDLSQEGTYLHATDLETGVKAALDCETEEFGKFAVDAKILYEIVRTLPNEGKVQLSFSSGLLSVESGRSRFRVPTMDPSEFPQVTLPAEGYSLAVEAKTISEMIERVIFCAAKDEFMRNLNGVFWEIGNGFLRLVASDGFRLALAEERLATQSESNFLISLKSMKELQSILQNCSQSTVTIRYDGKRLSLSTSNIETVMRVVEIDFPDYKKVLPKAFKSKVILSKNDLLEALRRTMVIAKRGSESAKLEINEEVLSLSSRSPDSGEVNEEIFVRKEGEDIVAAFNPTFLLEALRHIHTDEVEFNFVDSTSPLQINPLNVEGYLYIVMPIRIV
ncbi:DNA polymerase III subunit beta [Pseudothermotoga sp. U03pept]|uniref:DNA polymerase III subunit beta n=1 Tax=Pseudothermotoga sp. U03pept TaxID=3447012 RepID=UPI003EFF0BBC